MAQNEPTNKGHQAHVKADGVERQEVVHIDIEHGAVVLIICSECRLIEAQCYHTKNSWNKEGTRLTCDLCGIDGT